jgi:hypothetical protein
MQEEVEDEDAPSVDTIIGDGEAPRPASSMVLNLNVTETEVDKLRARIQETRQKTLRNRADVPEPEIRSTPIDDISRQRVSILNISFAVSPLINRSVWPLSQSMINGSLGFKEDGLFCRLGEC